MQPLRIVTGGPTPRWTLRRWDELERDELYEILRLRARVFVVEQRCAALDLDGIDRRAWHLWTAAPGGAPQAYLRLFAAGDRFSQVGIGRVVTAADARGLGLGRQLMAVGLECAARLFGRVPVRVSAQAYLEHFYTELGFVRISANYDEDGIPHLAMVRTALAED